MNRAKGITPVIAGIILLFIAISMIGLVGLYQITTMGQAGETVERTSVPYYCEQAASLIIKEINVEKTLGNITITNNGGIPLHTKYLSAYIAENSYSAYKPVEIVLEDKIIGINEEYIINLTDPIQITGGNLIKVLGECRAGDIVLIKKLFAIIIISPDRADVIYSLVHP